MEQSEFIQKEEIQRVCKSCGRLEERCRCAARDIQEVKAIRNYPNPDYVKTNDKVLFQSESERLAIIEKKLADKAERMAARDEMSQIMTMEPEEFANKKSEEEQLKKALSKKLEDEAGVRATLIQQKKAELQAKGMNSSEVSKAMKAFKKELKGEASDIEADKQPEQGALINPVKDPITGQMVEGKK